MVLLRLLAGLVAGLFWMVAGVVALVLISLLPLSLGLPIYLGPVTALLVLVALGTTCQILRRQRGLAILHYLAQCVRLNLPLPRMLGAARLGEGMMLRRRLGRLRDAFAAGEPIGTALNRHVPEVPERTATMLGGAARTGQLSNVLDHLIESGRRDQRDDQGERIIGYVYEGIVLVGTLGVLSGLSAFVLPQFLVIFEDFGVEMPAVTQFIMTAAQGGGPMLVLVATVTALAVAGRATWAVVRGRPGARLLEPELADPVIWRLPVLGTLARDRGLAEVCQSIAGSLGAGLTLERAVDEARRLQVSVVLRKRLAHFADALRDGQPLREAARRARLPRLMRGMLGTLEVGSDAQPVFAFLHRYHDSRHHRLAIAARQVAGPMAILILAACVGLIAFAMFAPLVELMYSVNIYHFEEAL